MKTPGDQITLASLAGERARAGAHVAVECDARLVAGTAQLGMAYGIANRAGAPSRASTAGVVACMLECGIRWFDTAQAYGQSETFLGAALRELGAAAEVRVISKLDPGLSPADGAAVLHAVEQSVERLGAPLWGMLLHRAAWLGRWEDGLGEALGEARRQGLVEHLGTSVYTVEEARRVLSHEAMEMVQAPANAWDQRAPRQGVLREAAARGKLCFVRSIFLQGLLTLPPETVAARFAWAHPAALAWQGLVRRWATEPEALAVRCALTFGVPLVVGMETAEQVRTNARLCELPPLAASELDEIYETMSPVVEERILDPSRWKEAE